MNKYTKCPHCDKVVKVLKNMSMTKHKHCGKSCEGSGKKVEAFVSGFLKNKYVAKDENGNVLNTRKTENEYHFVGMYWGDWFTYSKNPLGDTYTLSKDESTPLTHLTLELVEEKIKEEIPFAFSLETKEEETKEEETKEEKALPSSISVHGFKIVFKEGYDRNYEEELKFFTESCCESYLRRELWTNHQETRLIFAIYEAVGSFKKACDMFGAGFIIITKEDEVEAEEVAPMIIKKMSTKQIDFLKSLISLHFSFCENGKWIEVLNAPDLVAGLEGTLPSFKSTERRFLIQLIRKIKKAMGEEIHIVRRGKKEELKKAVKLTGAEEALLEYAKKMNADYIEHLRFMVECKVSVKVAKSLLKKLQVAPLPPSPKKEEPVKVEKEEPVKEEPVKDSTLEIPMYSLLPSPMKKELKTACEDLNAVAKVNDTQSLEITAPASILSLLKTETENMMDNYFVDELEGVFNLIEIELQKC